MSSTYTSLLGQTIRGRLDKIQAPSQSGPVKLMLYLDVHFKSKFACRAMSAAQVKVTCEIRN